MQAQKLYKHKYLGNDVKALETVEDQEGLYCKVWDFKKEKVVYVETTNYVEVNEDVSSCYDTSNIEIHSPMKNRDKNNNRIQEVEFSTTDKLSAPEGKSRHKKELKRLNKNIKYLNAFIRAAEASDKEGIELHLSKLVFYGVKAINSLPELNKQTYFNETLNRFKFSQSILYAMKKLTPKEFMNIFPIAKEFDGDSYGTKDYFYTMDYLKSLDMDKPIGENILEFLWEYHNWTISIFNVEVIGFLSDFRRLQGKTSLAQQWANSNGIETYSMQNDCNGNLTIDKEETVQFGKVRPKYIKLIK